MSSVDRCFGGIWFCEIYTNRFFQYVECFCIILLNSDAAVGFQCLAGGCYSWTWFVLFENGALVLLHNRGADVIGRYAIFVKAVLLVLF